MSALLEAATILAVWLVVVPAQSKMYKQIMW